MKNRIRKFLINLLRLDNYYTKDEVDNMIGHYLKKTIDSSNRTLATIKHIESVLKTREKENKNKENKNKEKNGGKREKERGKRANTRAKE